MLNVSLDACEEPDEPLSKLLIKGIISGIVQGNTIEGIKGDTRSLDYSSDG